MAQVRSKQQITKESQPIKQSFVSKYLLCCFSHKYKKPKSSIRQSSSTSKTKQKLQVPKLLPKAVKIFDINDQHTEVQALKFKQIKIPQMPQSGGRLARSQLYGMENNEAVAPKRIEEPSVLDFRLDDNPGVSNTFQLPFFEYGGLTQNKYYPKSTINRIRVDGSV